MRSILKVGFVVATLFGSAPLVGAPQFQGGAVDPSGTTYASGDVLSVRRLYEGNSFQLQISTSGNVQGLNLPASVNATAIIDACERTALVALAAKLPFEVSTTAAGRVIYCQVHSNEFNVPGAG